MNQKISLCLHLVNKNAMQVLKETNFAFLGPVRRGKVRDIYDLGDRLVLISTDRHSSFDRIIAHIPGKGAVLNGISAFWFKETEDICPNHLLATPDPAVSVVKKYKPLPIEFVVRGYITGSTNTSLWTLYNSGQRDFGNFVLPDGMKKNQRLSSPVLTPTTKSDAHDRPVTPEQIVSEGLLPKETWERAAELALKIFSRGQNEAATRGLILVDTKYEFGMDEHGEIFLIDEVHTPDSSRWWQAASFAQRIARGEEPESFDKEFLRLWFKEHCDPYNDPVLPEAPPELVAELSRRYFHIYQQITGGQLVLDDTKDPEVRIQDNLESYVHA